MPTDRRQRDVLKEAKEIRVKSKSLSGTSRNNSRPLQKVSPSHLFKRLLVFSLSLPVICLIGLMVFAAFASAEPDTEISSKQNQAESVRAEISQLNMGLAAKVEAFNQANLELGRIEASISDNQARLNEASVNLDLTMDRLELRLVNIYKHGSVQMLDVLMETRDINEFMNTVDLLAMVGEQDRNDLEQVKMLKIQIEEAKVQLDADQSRQGATIAQIDSEKVAIKAGISEKNSMLSGIEGEIAALEQEREAALKRENEVRLARAAAASSGGRGGGGGGGGYGPAPASTSGGVVDIAMQYLGVPYVWGGADPSGFDCSGLTMYVYAQVGIYLDHSTYSQINAGTRISPDELAPGDLVFFYGVSHVGIYIGGGNMIHAPYPGAVVEISPVDYGSMDGAVRL